MSTRAREAFSDWTAMLPLQPSTTNHQPSTACSPKLCSKANLQLPEAPIGPKPAWLYSGYAIESWELGTIHLLGFLAIHGHGMAIGNPSSFNCLGRSSRWRPKVDLIRSITHHSKGQEAVLFPVRTIHFPGSNLMRT